MSAHAYQRMQKECYEATASCDAQRLLQRADTLHNQLAFPVRSLYADASSCIHTLTPAASACMHARPCPQNVI